MEKKERRTKEMKGVGERMNNFNRKTHRKYIQNIVKKHGSFPINLSMLLDYELWKMCMQIGGVSQELKGKE